MEPTAQDVNAVSAMLGEQPAPQAPAPQPQAPAPQPEPTPAPQAPAQQQPAQPTPQAAPTAQPLDPFSAFAQPQPQPAPQQEPIQPAQPTEPTPQPQQPVEPQPTPPVQPAPQPQGEQFQSFDDYMASVTEGIGEPVQTPDPSKIDPNDEAGISKFFDDLVETAVKKAEQNIRKDNAIQNSERQLWEGAFSKYESLRGNKQLRDLVHSIRMGEMQRGIAITPTQAADRLLATMQSQYNQGVADNQVVTTIQQVQPNGGGSAPVQTTQTTENVLTAIQHGGEEALAAYLDGEVKAGRI